MPLFGPIITSPTEGEIDVSLTPTIVWDVYVGLSLSLDVEILTDPEARESVVWSVSDLPIDSTSVIVDTPLPANTLLYVRCNGRGPSVFGEFVSFTTKADEPLPPEPVPAVEEFTLLQFMMMQEQK